MSTLHEKYTHLSTISRTPTCEVVLVESMEDTHPYLIKSIIVNKHDDRHLDVKKRFCREMEIVASLDHPNIVHPVETHINGSTFYIVYPFEEGATLTQWLERQGRLGELDALAIIKQVLFALEYIHGRGIIHADVNPSNIYITRENRAVLIDFGYSMAENEARLLPEGRIIGTFPYLSPEQMGFTDFKIDTRTDLFCLMIVLYRMISGLLPFPMRQETIKGLLDATLKRDVSGILNVPMALNEMLIKGLRPTQKDRYQTAGGLLHDVMAVADLIKNGHSDIIEVGKKDTIVSVNRKRIFVDRSAELDLLQQGYQRLLSGKSSSYLLYGKSGIGKTEIVNEFRSAISHTATEFISVKCNRFAPNQPYAIIRQLVIGYVSQKSSAEQAEVETIRNCIQKNCTEYSGLICSIIPEMKPWFERIDEIPIIEKEREADRILHVLILLVNTLVTIRKTVLIIDDLQWVDKITFLVVEKLIENKNICMVVCNYRTVENDDAAFCFGNDLFTVPFSRIVKIHEFGKDAIIQLAGRRFGNVPHVENLAEVLLGKTDGIPFVLNEAIRYLVGHQIVKSEGGRWIIDEPALFSLPELFDPVSLVLHKLSAVSETDLRVLNGASIVEGRFTNRLLSELVALEERLVMGCTSRLEQLGFLTSDYASGYVFVHDRIQEAIASLLSGDEQGRLFEKLGTLYLAMAEQDGERIFNAAECFLKTKNARKAIQLSYRAAMYAVQKVAFDVALRYFDKIQFLADSIPQDRPGQAIDLVRAQITFGNVLMMTGANEQALKIYKKLLDTGIYDRYVRLEILYAVGCVYNNMGRFTDSIPCFVDALRTMDIFLPENKPAIAARFLGEIARIAIVPTFMRMFGKERNDQWSLLKLRIMNRLSFSMTFTNMLGSMYLQFVANRFASATVDSYEKAEAFAMHAIAAYQLVRKKRAFRMLCKSEAIARKIGRTDILAFGKSYAGVCRYFHAEWQTAEETFKESIKLFTSIGDINGQIMSSVHLWKVWLMRGNMDAAIRQMHTTIELCKKVNEQYFMVVTYAALNYAMVLKTGKYNHDRYADIVARLETVDSVLFHVEAGGYLLNTEIELGNFQAAYDGTKKMLPTIWSKCFNSEHQASACARISNVLCKEIVRRKNKQRTIAVSGVTLLRHLLLYTAIHGLSCFSFPAYTGTLYKNIAWIAAICKCKRIAMFLFRRAMARFHRMDMRYEEACTRKEYGEFLEVFANRPGDAHDVFIEAARQFAACGAKMQVERLSPYLVGEKRMFGDLEVIDDETGGFDRQSSSGMNTLRFDTLAEVSRSITEIDDPEVLFRQILSAMITVTGAQYGCFFGNKNNFNRYEPFAMSFEGREVPLQSVPVFADLINKVNEIHLLQTTQETMLDDDIDTRTEQVRSDLCVPLNWRDKYLGYIYLVNDRVRGLFGEGAQKSALILAAHAGILLENANLMSKHKKFNEDLQTQVTIQTADILEKKLQLEAANLKLLESERMKGILSGTLVHDIKNYAAGISGNLEYLRRRIENDQKSRRIIDVVTETCLDIASLASNLLDIAKMDDGKMVVRSEPLEYSFFEAMSEKFGRTPLFEEKEIMPEVHIVKKTVHLFADVYLLERVLQNLYNNAAKYAPRGARVVLTVDGNADEDILCFFNSGVPIPEEEKEILFEKYARLNQRKSQYSKGVGLFFCRMVMNAHCGRIWLDTDETGNYFKMAFPRKKNNLQSWGT